MIKTATRADLKINTYGVTVLANKNGILFYVCEIFHRIYTGYAVFSSLENMIQYINKEQVRLLPYGKLEYDPNHVFSNTLTNAYVNMEHPFSSVKNRQVYGYE